MVVLFNAAVGEPVFRVTTDTTLADTTKWHFVVAQFDGTQALQENRLTVSIDDTVRTLVKPDWAGNYALPTQLAASANSPFEWGKVSAYTPGFNGYLGETAIMQNLLSAEERSDWRTNGIDFNHPNLVAGYRWRGNLTDESEETNNLGTSTIDSGDYFTTVAYPSRSASAGPAYPEGNVSGYVRKVLGGGEVRFDANGRHRATVDRNGNQTVFRHTQYGGETRLTSIELPTKAGPAPVYRFSYQSSNLRLSTVQALGGNGSWLSYAVKAVPIDGTSSFTLDSLVTPDALRTGFDYDAEDAGLIREVRDHRGAKTQVDYTHGKVSEVRVVSTNPATTAEMPYDAYSVVGAEVPVPAEGVSAFFDGARADVADTTRFFVTHWGGVRGIRDALGATTWLSRTEPEHPALVTAVRYPNQRVVSVTYGPGGLPRTVTDDTIQATTTYEWDLKWRRVTSILSPEGETVSLLYDPATGNRLRETLGIDTNQHTTHYYYDGFGLLTSILPPGYSSSNMHGFDYDELGNLSVQTTPLGIETTAYNDATGLDTLVVSPIEGTLTRQTRTRRDRMGRDTLAITTNTKDATWLHVLTGYNEQKDRKSVETWVWHPTDGEVRGDSIGWTYDQLGRVHQEFGPAAVTYRYDLVGNLTRKMGSDTTQWLYYDALNRPDSMITREATFSAMSGYIDPFPAITIPRNKAVFTYDPVTGDMRTANNRYARISRTYTPDGLVATDTLHIRALADTTDFTTHTYVIGYRYDLNRRRTHIDHQGWLLGGEAGSTEYAYNALGFLESVTDPGDQAYVFGYDAKDRLVSRRFPGTGLDTLLYDLDGRLTWRKVTTGVLTGDFFKWDLDYDKRDKLTSASGGGGVSEFDYSGLGHLTAATGATYWGLNEDESFTTDGLGNVVIRELVSPVVQGDRAGLR